MDPELPSAAELGISDVEYERILHGLGRHQPAQEPPGEAETRRRSRGWLTLVVLGAVAAMLLVRQVPTGPDDREPAYAFLDTSGDQPVTYSSCRLIQVAVYPAGGPPDAEELVREAVGQLRSATGLDIVVSGAFGGHAPNWDFAAAPVTRVDPISVSWQDADAIARMTDDIAGLGGSRVVAGPGGHPERMGGTVALSRDYYAMADRRGDHGKELGVLLHELGHVFGLDHVDSPSEVMYPYAGPIALGRGDLEGLRRLGQGPCA